MSELPHWEFLRQQQRTLRLKPLFDHVREHYAEKLSVADAAALVGMSAPQFMKTFKKVAGTTLVAYLNHVRLANGSRLLRETEPEHGGDRQRRRLRRSELLRQALQARVRPDADGLPRRHAGQNRRNVRRNSPSPSRGSGAYRSPRHGPFHAVHHGPVVLPGPVSPVLPRVSRSCSRSRHAQSAPGSLPRLQVSENTRFLVTADGAPFFWLGDTAWELFHRLNREEAERYLRNRAERRFTVIQAVALAELDGLDDPNPYGERPLIDHDPARPNERYFEHVDWIVAKANALGLYVGLLPTWGDKWNKKWGVGPEIFTPENAEAYGEWLGRRYETRRHRLDPRRRSAGRERRRTGTSSRRWRAACAPATAART